MVEVFYRNPVSLTLRGRDSVGIPIVLTCYEVGAARTVDNLYIISPILVGLDEFLSYAGGEQLSSTELFCGPSSANALEIIQPMSLGNWLLNFLPPEFSRPWTVASTETGFLTQTA